MLNFYMVGVLLVQQPMEELLSQLAYKDSRIIELDSEIQKLHEIVIDLRENISEKNEVIRSRDQALQIMREMQAGLESNAGEEAERKDENLTATEADSEVVLQLQKQLQETVEQVTAREKSVELLQEELNTRNQYIADLTSYLTNFQNNYTILQASYTDSETARSAAVTNCDELEKRITDLETAYNEMVTKQKSLEEQNAALEQYSAATQASHAELNQRYVALEESYSTLQQKHTALENSYVDLTHLELEQAHGALVQSQSELQASGAGSDDEAGAAVQESVSVSSQPTEQDQQCEELRASLADCESRFSKFKSLSGSKIKSLEKELSALKQVTVA